VDGEEEGCMEGGWEMDWAADHSWAGTGGGVGGDVFWDDWQPVNVQATMSEVAHERDLGMARKDRINAL
jgi:hypothetical protein